MIKFSVVRLKPDNSPRLAVVTPYHPHFPPAAKKLGGRWDAGNKLWHFDPRDEDAVRLICREIYADDGRADPSDLVTVRIKLAEYPGRDDNRLGISACGREICRIWGRDGGAKVGDGVSLISGRLDSAGSRKHPRLIWTDDTVVDVRDVPRAVAEREATKAGVQIVEQESASDAATRIRDELLANAQRLIAEQLARATNAQLESFVARGRAITFED